MEKMRLQFLDATRQVPRRVSLHGIALASGVVAAVPRLNDRAAMMCTKKSVAWASINVAAVVRSLDPIANEKLELQRQLMTDGAEHRKRQQLDK